MTLPDPSVNKVARRGMSARVVRQTPAQHGRVPVSFLLTALCHGAKYNDSSSVAESLLTREDRIALQLKVSKILNISSF